LGASKALLQNKKHRKHWIDANGKQLDPIDNTSYNQNLRNYSFSLLFVTSAHVLNRVDCSTKYACSYTLSDIIIADGKEIDLSKTHGKNTATCPSKAAYIWPTVPTPKTTEIAPWWDTICNNGTTKMQ